MYLKVKVVVDAKAQKVEKNEDDNSWRICVKVPAENNAANNKVLELIRDEYPGCSVRIVSGHHSPSKIVSID